MGWVRRHFQRYRERGPWGFCWRIGIESTVVSLAAAIVLVTILGTRERTFMDMSMGQVFVLLLMVAPPVETLVFQALPIFVVRWRRGSLRTQIGVSTLLFAAAHFPEGIAVGVSAGIIGGLYFSFAYAHWRGTSRWRAFWVTTLVHAIHNGIAFIMLLVAGNWA
jgi:hypothetical protein